MILCVAGKMASGKNQASRFLEKHNCVSIDADTIAHRAMKKKETEILKTFLPFARSKKIDLIKNDNTIDRRALGKLLFSNKKLLQMQENILYPEIEKLMFEFIFENKNANIVLNATLLYKTPRLMNLCEKIIYIDCPVLLRFIRAKKRDALSSIEICKRFATQVFLEREYKKTKIPMIKIHNNSSVIALEKKIDALAKTIF